MKEKSLSSLKSAVRKKIDGGNKKQSVSTPLSFVIGNKTPEIPVKILLNGIRIADIHESGRGSHGEFYYYTIISDGNEVHRADSAQVYGSISAGEWLPVEDVEIYTGKDTPFSGSLSIGFFLRESDDNNGLKSVISAGGKLGEAVIKGYLASKGSKDPTDHGLASAVVGLVNSFIDLGSDDEVVSRTEAYHEFQNFNVGKFLTFIESGGGCVGICSIVPEEYLKKPDFFRFMEDRIDPGRKIILLKAQKKARVSFFVKRFGHGAFPKATMLLRRKGGGWTSKVGSFQYWAIRNYLVDPGDYELVITSLLPVDAKVMYTAVGNDLAYDDGIR